MEPAWGLRKHWTVSALYLAVSMVTSYWFIYESIFPAFFAEFPEEITSIPRVPLAWMVMTTDLLVLGGLIIVLGPKTLFRACSSPVWSIGKCIGIAFLCYWPLRIVGSLNRHLVGSEQAALPDISMLSESLLAVLDQFGPLGLIATIAIMTPIIEEVIFRGVILGSLARHIPFGWANVIQAALFTVVHEQTSFFPFLFVFGIITGLIRRQSSSLLPCILLHTINNGAIALGLIFVSRHIL